jgi:tRNA pseudouridine55 synthase
MDDTPLLIDKPVGFSSFQIVRILKKYYAKVGHAGTLDPFASGLLIILTDRATRQFESIQKQEKEYHGEMLLGMATDTYDITGRQLGPAVKLENLNLAVLNRVFVQFTGEIQQTPPKFSALKYQGKKLYQLSRRGQKVEVQARTVSVKSLSVKDWDPPILRFRAVVGKGVYIRSLAHDLGKVLNCGATLASLRRTRIGKYEVTSAMKIGKILSQPCKF